jgi:hypothetical protein
MTNQKKKRGPPTEGKPLGTAADTSRVRHNRWPHRSSSVSRGRRLGLRAEVRRVPGADHQAHGGESRNALSRLVANEVVVLEPTRRVSTGCAEEGPN